ncbi:ABC transporter permease [Dethiosulfovibrio salsuginis]|uniref:Osmoprotectant transport system permease protein n=1 Tax=Dethiosulfovibrio salsuginis TaxID=561720 RepID=A0A1X7JTB0_9BACT|nr:ABC transporter permease [Dethiosulfovibrio salsuginis]SMG31411.1 osmoprotectant transport system permease protein [Dethiosulfovibrio salsuginis]
MFLKYYHVKLLDALLEHLLIVGLSVPVALFLSLPLGIWISSRPRVARWVIYGSGILMTIPSLALFGIMVALLSSFKLGLGLVPAVSAIAIYSLLPITRNTYIALNGVSQSIIEAATGVGLSKSQILWRVKMPLALPVIMAGVRLAVVMGVSVAAFASLVGAGGLGTFIFSGIARSNLMMVGAGAILVALLGIAANWILLSLERAITPKGLIVDENR